MDPINHCSASAAEKSQEELTCADSNVCLHTWAHQIVRTHKGTCILQSRAVPLALIDPITFSKAANAVPYGEPIQMKIQLFLMDTLNNKPVGGGFPDKLQLTWLSYIMLMWGAEMPSCLMGGVVIHSSFIIEEPYLIFPLVLYVNGKQGGYL